MEKYSDRYIEELKKEFNSLSLYHDALMSRAKILRKELDLIVEELNAIDY